MEGHCLEVIHLWRNEISLFDIKDSMTVHCGYAHESNMHVFSS
jgi:hypothetical protein